MNNEHSRRTEELNQLRVECVEWRALLGQLRPSCGGSSQLRVLTQKFKELTNEWENFCADCMKRTSDTNREAHELQRGGVPQEDSKDEGVQGHWQRSLRQLNKLWAMSLVSMESTSKQRILRCSSELSKRISGIAREASDGVESQVIPSLALHKLSKHRAFPSEISNRSAFSDEILSQRKRQCFPHRVTPPLAPTLEEFTSERSDSVSFHCNPEEIKQAIRVLKRANLLKPGNTQVLSKLAELSKDKAGSGNLELLLQLVGVSSSRRPRHQLKGKPPHQRPRSHKESAVTSPKGLLQHFDLKLSPENCSVGDNSLIELLNCPDPGHSIDFAQDFELSNSELGSPRPC